MTLTVADRRRISLMVGLGIPPLEVAADYGIRARDVERIDVAHRRKRRAAEPMPELKTMNWRTTRPAAELYLPSDGCLWPVGDPREDGFGFCGHRRVPGYPYCGGHCSRAYTTFVAEAA